MNKINRLLSVILAVALIIGMVIPESSFVFANDEGTTSQSYESPLTSISDMSNDGWVGAFSSDPQNGVAFENVDISNLFECWGGGVTRRQNEYYHWNGFNWRNPFIKTAATTYTGNQYKYFKMTLDYKYNNNSSAWPAITFGHSTTTPEMFYAPINGGNATAASPTGGDNAIGVYIQYEGHLSIAGKNASSSVANKNPFSTAQWRKVEIEVTPDFVKATIYNPDNSVAISTESELSEDYVGGYISLMMGVPYSFYRNISITELEIEESEDDIEVDTYTNELKNIANLKNDGWSGAYSSDPQSGVEFENVDLGELFECWGGGITRNQNSYYKWSFNWKNPFLKTAAMTYTEKEYKYFKMSLDYKYQNSSSAWPAITFGQPDTTPEMFYAPIGGGEATAATPSGGNSAIGIYPQYEGHLTIAGKNASSSVANKTPFSTAQWRKIEIEVTPGSVKATIYNPDNSVAISTESHLSEDYVGGYISLMLGAPCSFYRNISIIELEIEDDIDTDTYTTDLRNVENLKNDGWSGAYSSNPQDAVAFNDVDMDNLFECWGGGITRKQNEYYHWRGFNWKDPFTNMGALTYTAQKYKYFTMTVDYKFGERNSVWPAISFGQPETTPEMFYAPIAYSDVQSNPKDVGNDAIGIYVQYEGYLNVAGKNATGASNVNAYDTADWHTMKLSVVPGMVEVVLYDAEGNPVSTTTAILSDDYEGGYVSLMMGVPYSFFRNFSITEYECLDMSQTEDSTEATTQLTKEQCRKPIVVKATPKRLYDFLSIAPDEASGVEYEINNVTSNIYLIEKAKPSVLTVKYIERELDYDPEYTLKYYFDWDEELDDFEALRTPNPADESLELTDLSKIWKIRDGVLQKPVIDFSGTDKTSDPWFDFNTLMLNTYKFRNFELTIQYKHGRKGGFACGVIFGIKNPTMFTDQEAGGIFAAVESDARGLLQGKSIRNRDSLLRIMPGEGVTNLTGYPKYDTTQIHTMRIKVLDGRAYMYIDDITEPVTAIIPRDFYGNIALAVGNNLAWFDNLTIQPLNEWGEKISLAESEHQYEYSSDDIRTDIWNGDNSEWGESPIDYFK